MPVYTPTEARKDLYNIIDEVRKSHQPATIKGRRGAAVLLPEEDYLSLIETVRLFSNPENVRLMQQAESEDFSTYEDWDESILDLPD